MPKEIPLHIPMPEPEIKVIAERRKKPRSEQRIISVDSELEGVKLLVEKGKERPRLSKSKVVRIQADFDRVARYRGMKPDYEEARQRLIDEAEDQDGFVGIISDRGGYRGPLVSNDHFSYEPELLERSTGENHKNLTRDEGVVVFEIPFGSEQDISEELDDITEALINVFVQKGYKSEDIKRMVSVVINRRLDEEKLEQFISEGKIDLLPGTRKNKPTWATPIRTIDKKTKPNRQRRLAKKNQP